MKNFFPRAVTWSGALALAAAVAGAPAPAAPARAGGTMAVASPAAVTHFVKPDVFDFKALLPPPPAPESLAAKADLDAVLQVQGWRTPEDVAWAKLVEADNVFNHADIIGRWFAPENLPVTAAFFHDIGDDLRALEAAAKKLFSRARPPGVDASVQPCVTVPASSSYPSGSALQAFVWAEILAGIFPEKRGELILRAERAAWGRVVGGVHFPTDIVAGRTLADAYLAQCRKSPAFHTALDQCRAELEPMAAAKAK